MTDDRVTSPCYCGRFTLAGTDKPQSCGDLSCLPAPTPVEAVRERLAQMRALCDLDNVYRARTGITWESDYVHNNADDEERYIAAASPDLMLQLVTWAEDVLQRHSYDAIWDRCDFHEYGTQDSDWPCAEVRAVLKAWLP